MYFSHVRSAAEMACLSRMTCSCRMCKWNTELIFLLHMCHTTCNSRVCFKTIPPKQGQYSEQVCMYSELEKHFWVFFFLVLSISVEKWCTVVKLFMYQILYVFSIFSVFPVNNYCIDIYFYILLCHITLCVHVVIEVWNCKYFIWTENSSFSERKKNLHVIILKKWITCTCERVDNWPIITLDIMKSHLHKTLTQTHTPSLTCVVQYKYRHTHTGILVRTFSREFCMQPWTNTSEFSWMNMAFLCMCVKFNYPTMDYPLPLFKSIIGHFFFYMHAYAICYWMAGRGWSLTIVDVHGWCVSTVLCNFSDGCPWLKVLKNAHTHM